MYGDNNNGLGTLDALAIFSVILQAMGYQENKQQSSNDDLMHELQKQNKEYLERIVENQKLILDKLAKLG